MGILYGKLIKLIKVRLKNDLKLKNYNNIK